METCIHKGINDQWTFFNWYYGLDPELATQETYMGSMKCNGGS